MPAHYAIITHKEVSTQASMEFWMPSVTNRQEILSYIRSQKEHLHTAYHIRRIALIGSFARDEQRPDSDVDLLIDLEEGTPDIRKVKRDLKNALEDRFGRRVELASERYLKSYYREEVLRDAIYV
jgi:predicted nucleotidyltransferase